MILKAAPPQIYKDQMAGLINLYDGVDMEIMERLSQKPPYSVCSAEQGSRRL